MSDPLWYKDAIIYELHVRTFHDSNADGIGDFRGLMEKLDYLQELGISAIWLLPFYPSPLKDDGYDIANYLDVNPNYGTLDDFRVFLDAAHERGLRVITELVINHTSDQNPWFQKSRRAPPGSPEREVYVWSDTPEKYKDARIIFKDFETSNWSWDPIAKSYYWHRFYSHQPDLNFDNPAVHEVVERVCDFWLKLGVDGLRLDAVPYLYEREGTNCENLPETHVYLKNLRAHIDAHFSGRMLLAEANQWPEDAVAYFGNGDESHMNFHFPLMPRMFMALQMEDRFPIIDILEQTPAIPDNCQWAMFLRNHDELTLEMVTDEERDYMWRVYANDPTARINLGIRRRLAPLLVNSRRKIELLNILLFSMPGTPVLYYGDEIGMGDNFYLGDRNGCRTPMQWSADRNAGFSKANPQQLYLPITIDPEYHYEAINVENQQKNLSSLLWWMRRVIAMRKNYKAFSRGSLEFLFPENPKVLAFLRRTEDETILVVVNLSRFAQPVELDLAKFSGCIPMEVFSRNRFPAIRRSRYLLTLGPHAHYWFVLQSPSAATRARKRARTPTIASMPGFSELLTGSARRDLERTILPNYLTGCRWFGAKARTIRELRIVEDPLISPHPSGARHVLLEVNYTEGAAEIYTLPLQIARDENAHRISREAQQAVIAEFANSNAILHDATFDPDYRAEIYRIIREQRKLRARRGEIVGSPSAQFAAAEDLSANSRVMRGEQSNSSILFGTQYFLKIFRKLEEGINPDVEITRFLTERAKFPNVPAFAGTLEYRSGKNTVVLALIQSAIANEGDAWTFTLDSVGSYYDRVLSRKADLNEISSAQLIQELIGGIYPEKARLLGQRTGELHRALASETDDPAFAPEPFNALAQRSVVQSMRASSRRAFELLRKKLDDLPDAFRAEAEEVLAAEKQILAQERRLLEQRSAAHKIRIHGDFHLGQALHTGRDFIFLDFEGEPARPLGERKLKRSALRDVAGMMRSFQYAAYSALWQPAMRQEDVPFLEKWADVWYREMSSTFLQSYLAATPDALFIPRNEADLRIALEAYLLDKAVYEIGYELNHRPDWVVIPIRGIKHILKSG
ncbi:MAG: maltose alpha-D-glucosyltransferase [Verrucomicrobia bacterium]|nr:MAG: maltose alpha-D-glucosyltransferase [Verrucomicrobiota bacterium]PYM09287.1 MAG: maltose alpha-D-glucosyltransferase [Verrucomicrobiota bacterium]